jgi:hypothetical protein
MSYQTAKRKYHDSTDTTSHDGPNNHNCFANGCPMAGGISTGGNWVCAYHHQALSDQWPRVTEALRDCERIRVAINEVMVIDMISWGAATNGYPPKWQEFAALFDDEPELQPTEHEKIRKTKYEYRLRNELAIRAGLAKRKA